MKRTLRRLGALAGALGLVAGLTLATAQGAAAYTPTAKSMYASANPSSCNKNPCTLYPKSAQLPSGRLVAAFEDSEGPVVGQTLPIYKSDDEGDTWQKLTDLKPPSSLSTDSQYAGYTSNWTNPYFYVLPQTLGNLPAGTLMLADVVSGPADSNNNRTNVAIVLYSSADQGATWNVVNVIAKGSSQVTDPVWEPYLMMYNGQLVAYYSDENDYLSYDKTTGVPTIDPDNATAKDSGGQILAHKTWSGTGAWSAPVVDVPGDTSDMGNGKTEIGANRPGMTNVVQTSDGKWLMTFEYYGGGSVGYKIASDPLKFFADGGNGTSVTSLPVASGSNTLAGGGSPTLMREPNGSIFYNAAASGDVWVNSSASSTGTWKEYHTSIGAGYSRNLQYLASSGRVEILQVPWNGGVPPVSYAQVDFGNSTGAYYSLVNKATGQVLAPKNGATQDAQFTGNAPDVVTQARDDSNVSQYWHTVKTGSTTTLLNKGGGRALGVWQGNVAAGSSVAQWVDDGGSDKAWNLVSTGDGYVQLQSASNTALYVTGSSTAGSSATLQNAATGSAADAQKWQLVPDFRTTSQSTYKIVNRGSGAVLGIYQGSTATGARAVQWTDTGAKDQTWTISSLSGGAVKLKNQNSGQALGIFSGSTASGAQAVQWTDTGATDQQFTINAVGQYFSIKDVNSGLLLGVAGGSTSTGANVVQATADGSLNQQWQFVQVSNQ